MSKMPEKLLGKVWLADVRPNPKRQRTGYKKQVT
jgi:hypothetical protein